jgi:CubicO group peptidase (beta-lactamase class C family)
LKLTGRDMARLGQLWLNTGRWAGRQLVTAAWVTESTTSHVDTQRTPEQYGYEPPILQRPPHPVKGLYAAKRGSRPLIGVAGGVFQSTPQWSRRRSR